MDILLPRCHPSPPAPKYLGSCSDFIGLSKERKRSQAMFRFINFWTEDERYLDIVKDGWSNKEKEQKLPNLMSNARLALVKWHKRYYGNLDTRIADLQNQLRSQFSTSAKDTSHGSCTLLEHRIQKPESLWKQKLHDGNLLLGAKNTRFFHQKFKWRKRKNKI